MQRGGKPKTFSNSIKSYQAEHFWLNIISDVETECNMDNFEDDIDNEEILSTLDENSNKDYFWEIDPLPPPHSGLWYYN